MHPHSRMSAGLAFIVLGASMLASAGAAPESPDAATRLVVGLHGIPPNLEEGDAYQGETVVGLNRALGFVVVESRDPAGFHRKVVQDPHARYLEAAPLLRWLQEPGQKAGALFTPDDPAFSSQQYGPQQIRADLAWDTTLGDLDAAVCIIDTGIRATHEDLAGSRWLGGRDFVNNDDDPSDDQGHGTHVAGTAAASIHNGKGIAGIANVGIYAAKVLNANGEGTIDQVASGITWCADNTMARTVLSLSLGAPSGSSALRDAVQYAYNTKGKLVVAAAGNAGPCSNCVSFPARYAEAVAVTCTTSSQDLCSFSSTGPEAELAAPGSQIRSTHHTSDTAYATMSGTSMSTPHVSGAAALTWSHLTGMTNVQLRQRLRDTSVDLGAAGHDANFGYGRVDAKCLLDGSGCGTTPPPATCETPGPDAFGYTCAVVPSAFQDISGTGTALSLADDAMSAAVPLGFTFSYYGSAFTEAFVGSNGFLAFSAQSQGCCTGQVLPDPASPNHLVAGYWEDLYPPGGGSVRYQTLGSAPDRLFVAQWTDIPHHPSGAPATFQVILREGTNRVEVQLLSATSDGGSHATGIEDGSGAAGLRYRSGSFGASSVGVAFNPPGPALPPVTTASLSGTPGSNGWWRSAVTVTLSCAPPAGASCAQTLRRTDGGAWQAYAGPFAVGGDGPHTVEYHSTASNGASESPGTTAFSIDATPPTVGIPLSCATPGTPGWCRGGLAAAPSASDAGSGIASQSCNLDGADVPCGVVPIGAQGAHTVALSATDLAGNGATASAVGRLDTAAPGIAFQSRTPANGEGWNNGDVLVTWTCSDATSGVVSPSVSAVVATEGAGQVATGTCRDLAGNAASDDQGGIHLDRTPPSMSAARSPAPNANGWSDGPVTVSFTCTDTLSGVSAAPGPTTVGTEGAGQSVSAMCSDRAGNAGAATVGDIHIDTTPPGITGTRAPGPNAQGWNNADVTVTFACTDALSGVAAVTPAQAVTAEAQDQSRTGTCADRAGNSADGVVSAIHIDKTSPDVGATRAPPPNGQGWNNGDVTVAFTCTDALSGAATSPGPQLVTAEGADQARTGLCTDRAGNTGSATLAGISIDRTPPALSGTRSPPSNGHGWVNTSVTVSFACTDALAGVLAVTADQVVSTEGLAQSRSGTCTDRAGNPATRSVGGISIDLTAPSITGSRSPGPNAAGWNREDVTVQFRCTDALSGVPSQPPSIIVRDEGEGLSRNGSCEDRAGNLAAAVVGDIHIDKTPPQLTGSRAPAPNAHGWNNADVAVSFACADALSGVDAVSPAAMVTEEGSALSRAGSCTDRAGNAAAIMVGDVNIDRTPPSLATSRTPPANLHGWNRENVTVAFACTDALAGVASVSPARVFSDEGASQQAEGSCSDSADNTAQAVVGDIHIDRTPPVLTATLEGVAGTGGWWRSTVNATLGCNDPLSGLAPGALRYRLNGGAEAEYAGPVPIAAEGRNLLASRCTDRAGNEGLRDDTVAIDTVAPDGDVTSPPFAIGPYNATWDVYDATSGVSRLVVEELPLLGLLGDYDEACAEDLPGTSGANFTGSCAREVQAGQYCYRVTVTDAAGNTFTSEGADIVEPLTLASALLKRCTVKLTPDGLDLQVGGTPPPRSHKGPG